MKRLRKEQNLTQENLAERADLEYKYIQMLEGKTPPSATLRTLAKIAKALDIEVWELVRFP
ncbi:MAG: helix-turn-helix transcriptional regulator [Bdellovibrionales bacterium]|nr:helix-turn-helix transcriptional regulator [Bdellovibrionales bacterium]